MIDTKSNAPSSATASPTTAKVGVLVNQHRVDVAKGIRYGDPHPDHLRQVEAMKNEAYNMPRNKERSESNKSAYEQNSSKKAAIHSQREKESRNADRFSR